jgi:hypothetical protein
MPALPFRVSGSDLPPPSNLDIALDLARHGLFVFPCDNSKRPCPGVRWRAESTCDEDQVLRLWKRWPDAMPGLDLARSGLVVVDADRHGGPDGIAAWELLAAGHGLNPQITPQVDTPGQGRHIYFRQEGSEFGNARGGLPAGIDVRGHGGYVIGPGANRGDGVYVLTGPHPVDALPLPPWLVEILQARRDPEPVLPRPSTAPRVQNNDRRVDAYVQSALSKELANVAQAIKGTRNQALNDAAFNIGQMVGSGWMDEAHARALLIEAAHANGMVRDDGLTAANKTISSGLTGGKGKPRTMPADERAADEERGAAMANALIESKLRKSEQPAAEQYLIDPTPFVWRDPSSIPRRRWLYGGHYIRQFVSTTIAPGGLGKSSLVIVEALAMVTQRPLLGVTAEEACRVWIWNGEDPREETERRVAAACIHFGIKSAEVSPSDLFVDSGRDTEICIAVQDKMGAKVAVPIVEAMVAAIERRGIDVVIIDPFVSSHRVNENDNGAIDAVAKAWAKIAERTSCAIELVHHARKTGGQEVTVEHSRGAVSLLSAARSARTLNGMEAEDAKAAGIHDNHRLYFRVDNGKANLRPPAAHSDWFKMVSVSLDNGDGGLLDNADSIGVVTPFEWPEMADELTVEEIKAVQERIAQGSWREDIRSKKTPWAGLAIAEVVGLNSDEAGMRERLKKMLRDLIQIGALKLVEELDEQRRVRNFVVVGH